MTVIITYIVIIYNIAIRPIRQLRTAFLGTLIFASFALLAGQNAYAEEEGPTKVRLSLIAFLGDATIYYAYRHGLFADEGLDIELVRFKAGAQALDALIDGKIDIGAVAPTPVVYTVMGRTGRDPDFRIFASVIHSTHLNNLIVLDSREIPDIQSLAGKRLALQQGTASDFFWHRMALANHLDPDSVTIVNIPTVDMASKLNEDLFDAVVAWSPYHLAIIEQTETPVEVYKGDNFYTTSWMTFARPDYIRDNPQVIDGFLRALKRAQDQLLKHPLSVATAQSELGSGTPEELLESYKNLTFNLSLTELLIVNLSQQGHWALEKGYVSQPVPDFRAFFDPAPLKRVAPESVLLLQ